MELCWKGKNTEEDLPMDKEVPKMGKLIYPSLTRPNIAFAVSVVSQFMHSPTQRNLNSVNHILRYPEGNPGKGPSLGKTNRREIESLLMLIGQDQLRIKSPQSVIVSKFGKICSLEEVRSNP